ncbi:NRDE family protein [Aquabacterium sp.]|uniref:NRDE family protein n=1 Tax=Aquabacterium sp. TaxID=1872578 RepID=UPI0035B4BE07
MCLAAVALGQNPRFPFVLASNRDEFFDRKAEPMQWWPDAAPFILAGRDLDAGGTWLGLSESGRLALLTNIRNPSEHRDTAASRGALVPEWLRSRDQFDAFWTRHDLAAYNGFNLMAFELSALVANGSSNPAGWYASSRHPRPRALASGVYGLSNAELDTPWPKVQALKRAMADSVTEAVDRDALAARLFAVLEDTQLAPDDQLPSTGVPLEAERALSAAHVNLFDGRYGTRCSTVLICERLDTGWLTAVLERTFHSGKPATQQQFVLPAWPPETPTS